MVYCKSVLAGIAPSAALTFVFIVYWFLRPAQHIHLVDEFTYKVGVPWVRELLPTRTVISLSVRIFPDVLVYFLILLVFAGGFYWEYRRVSRSTQF